MDHIIDGKWVKYNVILVIEISRKSVLELFWTWKIYLGWSKNYKISDGRFNLFHFIRLFCFIVLEADIIIWILWLSLRAKIHLCFDRKHLIFWLLSAVFSELLVFDADILWFESYDLNMEHFVDKFRNKILCWKLL